MSTIIDLMLLIRKDRSIFYHRDTNQFDYFPISAIERKNLSPGELLPYKDTNNVRLSSYEEVNHEELMRLFVKECVDDKEHRKQLFDILRRHEFIDAYIEKLHELDLYEDFIDACGDIYIQIFEEWAKENNLNFKQKV